MPSSINLKRLDDYDYDADADACKDVRPLAWERVRGSRRLTTPHPSMALQPISQTLLDRFSRIILASTSPRRKELMVQMVW